MKHKHPSNHAVPHATPKTTGESSESTPAKAAKTFTTQCIGRAVNKFVSDVSTFPSLSLRHLRCCSSARAFFLLRTFFARVHVLLDTDDGPFVGEGRKMRTESLNACVRDDVCVCARECVCGRKG